LALLLLLASPAGAGESGADDLLLGLNKSLSEVVILSRVGERNKQSRTSYVFRRENGRIAVREDYHGAITDGRGVYIEWSGTFIRTFDPHQVEVLSLEPKLNFFRVKCKGMAKCVESVARDETTWIRGEPVMGPMSSAGLSRSFNIMTGRPGLAKEKAAQEMRALVELLGQ